MRTVRKGWMRYDAGSKWIRVLVDDHGFVFARGHGGWMQPFEWEIRLLPGVYWCDFWPYKEWWRGNWRRPEWAWIYGAP